MEKIDFFRFSSNCPRRFLVMSKWFLSALRPSKQPPKFPDISWDHLEIFFSNDPSMCPEALGVALRVAKHLGTILTSLETVWDNLKKIEKNRFFPSILLKSLAVLSFASGNFLTGFQCNHGSPCARADSIRLRVFKAPYLS